MFFCYKFCSQSFLLALAVFRCRIHVSYISCRLNLLYSCVFHLNSNCIFKIFFVLASFQNNVAMLLETNYRERLHMVTNEIKRRMDYQIALQHLNRRLEQEHMVDWVENSVINSITPQQVSPFLLLLKSQLTSYSFGDVESKNPLCYDQNVIMHYKDKCIFMVELL